MKSLHFRLCTILALMLMVTLVGIAVGEDSNGKFKAALADNQSFIVTEYNEEHTYELAKDAMILIDTKLSSLSDLKEGDNVAVTWELRDNRRVASMVACTRE